MSVSEPEAPIGSPATVVAAWAARAGLGDHVCYERDGRWIFAAGTRAEVVLSTDVVTVVEGGVTIESRWLGSASTALARALESLDIPDWKVFGHLNFDFCAPHNGLMDRVPRGTVLAHLMVPEVIAVVDADGIEFERCDAETRALLSEIATRPGPEPVPTAVDVTVDQHGYRELVAAAVAEINRGDYQKVILSRRVDLPFAVDLPATYELGRRANNPARSFLLSMGGRAAAGFSPELVVSVDTEGTVVTEPLAGTRALAGSEETNARHREQLMTDAKEVAEHAISVKACYGEIESVARPDTTVVSEFMAIRPRGSVQHLASTVRGALDPGAGPWRALDALFPSITASGIPKPVALEAIYRLESQPRELYSGAVLMASAAGDLEATLALRTVFADETGSWIRAGAGVVGQSTPDREFEETCEKLNSVAPYLVRRSNSGADGVHDDGVHDDGVHGDSVNGGTR